MILAKLCLLLGVMIGFGNLLIKILEFNKPEE